MTGSVRPGTEADARTIAELHVQAWQWAYRELLPASHLAALSVDAREQMWRRLLAAPGTRVTQAGLLVWEQASRIRGFAAYGPARDTDLEARDAGQLLALYLATRAPAPSMPARVGPSTASRIAGGCAGAPTDRRVERSTRLERARTRWRGHGCGMMPSA